MQPKIGIEVHLCEWNRKGNGKGVVNAVKNETTNETANGGKGNVGN